MQLDQAVLDRASAAAIEAEDLIELLEDCNAIRASQKRDDMIGGLEFELEQLDQGISRQNEAVIFRAAEEIGLTGEIMRDLQELALIEWQAQYALFFQGFPTGNGDHYVMLLLRWLRVPSRYKPKSKKVPREVRDAYVVDLVERFEAVLSFEARTIGKLKDIGCLHFEDFKPLGLALKMLSTAAKSADRAAKEHVRSQRLKAAIKRQKQQLKAQRPGLGRRIWNVVGWDSPSDFFTDVVLIGATGGAGAAFRWAKKANKARKTLKKARKLSKRLKSKIDNLEDQLLNLEKQEARIRKNSEKIRRAGNLRRKLLRRFEDLKKGLKVAEGVIELVQPVMDALAASPKKLIRGIALSTAADLALQKTGGGGGSTSIAATHAARAAIKARLNLRHPFSELDDMKTRVIREAILDVIHPGYSAAKEYYSLLLGREILTRLIFEVPRKRTVTAEIVVKVLIPSFGAAGQEMFISFGLPEPITNRYANGLVDLIGKFSAGALKTLAKKILDAI